MIDRKNQHRLSYNEDGITRYAWLPKKEWVLQGTLTDALLFECEFDNDGYLYCDHYATSTTPLDELLPIGRKISDNKTIKSCKSALIYKGELYHLSWDHK